MTFLLFSTIIIWSTKTLPKYEKYFGSTKIIVSLFKFNYVMTYNEIRNVTGIYDDDELNCACECERKELLAEKIANKIVRFHGFHRGLYNGDVFKFAWIKEVFEDFGFKYEKSDDDEECHYFRNKETGDEISIYPITYYPNQDAFRFLNFHLS